MLSATEIMTWYGKASGLFYYYTALARSFENIGETGSDQGAISEDQAAGQGRSMACFSFLFFFS